MVTREKKMMDDGSIRPAALPEIDLEGNQIARNAVNSSVTDVLKNFTSKVATAMAGATGTGTKKSSGGTAKVKATNPYEGEMKSAQEVLNRTATPYVDSYGATIKQMEAEGPGEYNSKYSQNIDTLLTDLQNREAFNYSMSEDPLYRQLVAQHMTAGKQAMQDTMGQAAALTSGYGNSYAATAGNQAYQQHINDLNDDAMELYSMNRSYYDQEGENMRNNLSALQTAESMERSNFESDRSDYYNRLNALKDSQKTEYNRYLDQEDMLDEDQERAWEQYTYWNDLWEEKQ